MAKTIKFNLICDDKPVRTIEDLQDNFSIEDVIKYYKNGLLARWLDARGYSEEAKKVADINYSESLDIIKKLIKIFDVEADNEKIEEGVYILQFLEERKVLCEEYSKDNYKAKSIIDDYQAGYKQLIDGILENPNDIAKIKANISEMVSNYRWAMDLNHRELFWTLKDKSVLAIMCLLMNNVARDYYLPIRTNGDDESVNPIFDTESNTDKRDMFNAICTMIKASDFITKLGDNLHVFAGVTDGYWKDLETKGKKYMIINMGVGDFVRGAGVQGGDLASTDIVNKFVIVEGIDYKSNSSTRQLLYMEV